MNELVKLKDSQLLEKFSLVVIKEREVISEVVSYVAEIRTRKLYAEMGYSSLFSFLIEKYGYSGGAAYRRIQASKVYQRFPEVLKLLKEGKVNLMTLSLIEPHLDEKNQKGLIDKVLGKSKREVEEVLIEYAPQKQKTQDVIRRLPIKKSVLDNSAQNFTFTGESENESKENISASQKEPGASLEMPMALSDTGKKQAQEIRRVKIEFVAEEKVAKMIERAKELLRHKYPEGKLEDLVREAFELLLEKKDPERKILKQEKKEILRDNGSQDEAPSNTRYIPQEMKLNIWKRDRGQCVYESPNGKRCEEKVGLELDHIEPFALGGKSSEENLRLLCKAHNQWRGERTFGATYISWKQ